MSILELYALDLSHEMHAACNLDKLGNKEKAYEHLEEAKKILQKAMYDQWIELHTSGTVRSS
jgi:hypothetical protein